MQQFTPDSKIKLPKTESKEFKNEDYQHFSDVCKEVSDQIVELLFIKKELVIKDEEDFENRFKELIDKYLQEKYKVDERAKKICEKVIREAYLGEESDLKVIIEGYISRNMKEQSEVLVGEVSKFISDAQENWVKISEIIKESQLPSSITNFILADNANKVLENSNSTPNEIKKAQFIVERMLRTGKSSYFYGLEYDGGKPSLLWQVDKLAESENKDSENKDIAESGSRYVPESDLEKDEEISEDIYFYSLNDLMFRDFNFDTLVGESLTDEDFNLFTVGQVEHTTDKKKAASIFDKNQERKAFEKLKLIFSEILSKNKHLVLKIYGIHNPSIKKEKQINSVVLDMVAKNMCELLRKLIAGKLGQNNFEITNFLRQKSVDPKLKFKAMYMCLLRILLNDNEDYLDAYYDYHHSAGLRGVVYKLIARQTMQKSSPVRFVESFSLPFQAYVRSFSIANFGMQDDNLSLINSKKKNERDAVLRYILNKYFIYGSKPRAVLLNTAFDHNFAVKYKDVSLDMYSDSINHDKLIGILIEEFISHYEIEGKTDVEKANNALRAFISYNVIYDART